MKYDRPRADRKTIRAVMQEATPSCLDLGTCVD
jgi:hypothetical protein